jgi:hypothetical protein
MGSLSFGVSRETTASTGLALVTQIVRSIDDGMQEGFFILSVTGKQRMLNAYRGCFSDVPAVAPEFWYYYPAKLLGVDMIQFQREVPFHQALRTAFETFQCEGWGIASAPVPNDKVTCHSQDKWLV